MTANEKDYELARRFWNRGLNQIERYHCRELRRIEMALHRWHELECGVDAGRGGIQVVERDNDTGKPVVTVHWNDGHITRYSTPDREAGAIRRLKALCNSLGLHYYVQGDPRGCALYIDSAPLSDNAYTNGISCCIN